MRRLRLHVLHGIAALARRYRASEGRVVVVAPHPDDEVMGCGGLIQHLLIQGEDVHVVLLTGGESSHVGCCDVDPVMLKNVRRDLALSIGQHLGLRVENIHFLDYPDGGIVKSHRQTHELCTLIGSLDPKVVFVPHAAEGWPDHVNVARIVMSMVDEHVSIYEYCVWFWYYNVWAFRWSDARLLRLSKEECHKKRIAVDRYTTGLAPCGKPWSGVLPDVLLSGAKWNKELFFKIR